MTILHLLRHRPSARPSGTDDPGGPALPVEARTAALPRVLWIELTSRCPYRCPFCSRETLRGHGRNMPLDLYRRIVRQLRAPETLRLNYSGESSHHPHIVAAIAEAAATGAWVELVAVPAALPGGRLEAMIAAGLNRLTVSLHTLDEAQFQAIYGFGRLSTMLDRVHTAAALRGTTPQPFLLDFAFVATAANLDQLARVAELAEQLALPVLAVHPIIRRTPVPRSDGVEFAADGNLDDAFRGRLEAVLAEVRRRHPGLALQVSTPEVGCTTAERLGATPAAWPGALPAGAHLHGCDQDPFETLHVLADGTAVTCEVRDRISVGDLATTPLADVWHGDAMRAFRTAFVAARDPECARCPYKRAYVPGDLQPSVQPDRDGAQLLYGWHVPDDALVWSKREAALVLARPAGSTRLELSGMLPAGSEAGNELTVALDGRTVLRVDNPGPETRAVVAEVALPPQASGAAHAVLRFETSEAFRPARQGGADVRELGFGLIAAAIR